MNEKMCVFAMANMKNRMWMKIRTDGVISQVNWGIKKLWHAYIILSILIFAFGDLEAPCTEIYFDSIWVLIKSKYTITLTNLAK
jgi:hypothetical protein